MEPFVTVGILLAAEEKIKDLVVLFQKFVSHDGYVLSDVKIFPGRFGFGLMFAICAIFSLSLS